MHRLPPSKEGMAAGGAEIAELDFSCRPLRVSAYLRSRADASSRWFLTGSREGGKSFSSPAHQRLLAFASRRVIVLIIRTPPGFNQALRKRGSTKIPSRLPSSCSIKRHDAEARVGTPR